MEGNLNCLSAPNGSMLKILEDPSHSKLILTRHLKYQLGEMGDYENASCRPPTPGKGTDQMPRLPHWETHLHICAKTTPPTGCFQPRMGRAWLLWLGHSQEMRGPLLSESGSRTLPRPCWSLTCLLPPLFLSLRVKLASWSDGSPSFLWFPPQFFSQAKGSLSISPCSRLCLTGIPPALEAPVAAGTAAF